MIGTCAGQLAAFDSASAYKPRLIPLKAAFFFRSQERKNASAASWRFGMFGRLNGEGRDSIDVPLDKLAHIVLLARAFDAQISQSNLNDASNATDDGNVSILESQADNSIEQDLRRAIEGLSEDEQAVLVALAWIGRGDFDASEFDRALTMAFERRLSPTSDYLVGLPLLGDLLEQGAAVCGATLSGEETAWLYHIDGSAKH